MFKSFNRKTTAILLGGSSVIFNDALAWFLIVRLSNLNKTLDYFTNMNTGLSFVLLFFFLELPVCWAVLTILKDKPDNNTIVETRLANLLFVLLYLSIYAFSREPGEILIFCALSLITCWLCYAFWIFVLNKVMYKNQRLIFKKY